MGTLHKQDAGGLGVGDESMKLECMGSYLYVHKRYDMYGNSHYAVRRLNHSPNLRIKVVYSEGLEVNQHGYDMVWSKGEPRTFINHKSGRRYGLTMTESGLGWWRAVPITDPQMQMAILKQFKEKGTDPFEEEVLYVVDPGEARSTSMGKLPQRRGVELLRREHVINGHCGLERQLRTMKAKGMLERVTKDDVVAFAKEGCGVCESAKMKRRPFTRNPTDNTKPHIGKLWYCDALQYRVPSAVYGFVYGWIGVDSATGYEHYSGMLGYTAEVVESVTNGLRTFVRPLHGEIEHVRLDSHPSHKSRELGRYFKGTQLGAQYSPDYVHEGVGKAEVRFFHNVPAAMALLMAAPDLGEPHFHVAS